MIGFLGSRRLLAGLLFVSLATAACSQGAAPAPTQAPAKPAATAAPSGASASTPAPAAQKSQLPSVVKIGVSQPLTGDNAQYGDFAKRGIELAIAKMNSQPLIPGVQFQGVFEDDRDNGTEAVNVAQKLVGDNSIVAVIGNFSSTVCLATAPVYQKGGLVQVSTTAAHPDYGKQGEFIFRLAVTTPFESPYLADWAVKEIKAKKIASIGPNTDFGLSASKLFLDRVKESGGTVVGDERFQPGDKDFKPILTKLKAAQPDLIYTSAGFTDQALIDQQAKQVGLEARFISSGNLYSDEYVKLASGAAEGNYVATPFWPGAERATAKQFIAEYEAKYGVKPNKFPAFAYDAAMMIGNAVKAAGSADRRAVRNALASLKGYKGVIGDEVAFDNNREVPIQEDKLVIKGGAFVLWKP